MLAAVKMNFYITGAANRWMDLCKLLLFVFCNPTCQFVSELFIASWLETQKQQHREGVNHSFQNVWFWFYKIILVGDKTELCCDLMLIWVCHVFTVSSHEVHGSEKFIFWVRIWQENKTTTQSLQTYTCTSRTSHLFKKKFFISAKTAYHHLNMPQEPQQELIIIAERSAAEMVPDIVWEWMNRIQTNICLCTNTNTTE